VDRATGAFLPAPAHAQFDGALGFELLGRKHQFREGVDWDFLDYGPLWLFHLHQFDYLRSASVPPGSRWMLIDDWIEHCHEGGGWSPHPISLRILSWGKLLLTPGALSLDPGQAQRLNASLGQQAQALSERLETRLQGNHLFSNVLSCVFAGLMFEGKQADSWLALESSLLREFDLQILEDGSHVERSPMYHALLLENVLDLFNLASAVPERAQRSLIDGLEAAATRMLAAHRLWTHPDGEIALLGDSAFDIAHPPKELEAYATSLGITVQTPAEPFALNDAKVYRLESEDMVVIASASAPAPAYQPGHAHCDALSFELSVGGERVITDTGVMEYTPGALRDISRHTSSHATLEIDGEEQSEIWAAHRVGGRAEVSTVSATNDRLEAHCASWSRRRNRHHRLFELQGGCLEIHDRVDGPSTSLRFILPFAPDVAVSLETGADGGRVDVQLHSGKRMRVELPTGFAWAIEQRPYFPRFGERIDRPCLMGKSDNFVDGKWRFILAKGPAAEVD